jgi:tetratricopeptide (TPR) repeat protein
MKLKVLIFSMVIVLLVGSVSFAASVEKAIMLNEHSLVQEAKLELINVIFDSSDDKDKAEAYYLLGSIAFDENNISVALDSWRELVKKYPNSNQANTVKDRINELAEIVGESAKESVDNAIALSYLRHGDFWSRGKDKSFTIDSSWISNIEAAIKWYDKVISEFPQSNASKLAYKEKLRTLLGWEDPGRYGGKHGIRASYDKYMPQLLDTFASFEKDHPTASSLQAFRYQIAQVYWNNKDWDKTREWLNLIIDKSGEGDSFYKDLAQRRLQKVEY